MNMVKRINLKSANVARSSTIRDIDRQIILNHIREKSPISRAEIARFTELQRSTVSLIVEELKSIGLMKKSKANLRADDRRNFFRCERRTPSASASIWESGERFSPRAIWRGEFSSRNATLNRSKNKPARQE